MEDEFKLPKGAEIESIRLEPADNGGVVLRYDIYTAASTHSESKYESKTEVYTEDEMEEKVWPRMKQLYQAQFNQAKIKALTAKAAIPPPMKARG